MSIYFRARCVLNICSKRIFSCPARRLRALLPFAAIPTEFGRNPDKFTNRLTAHEANVIIIGMERIKGFLKGERFRELLTYLIAGVLTTLVNYLVYFLVTRGTALLMHTAPDGAGLLLAANIAAWICSVAFAFWSNKKYVFRSADWSRPTLKRELPGFLAARLFSLVFDAVFVELAVHAFGMNDLIAKLLSNILVIIINYFLSKFWIFRKKTSSDAHKP